MRFIPTRIHGLADYLVGLVVMMLPFFYDFRGTPQFVLVLLGGLLLLYSFMTDYEVGVVRFLRVRFHLFLDAVFGIIMLVMPRVIDFPGDSRWPITIIGVVALFLAATTQTRAAGTASIQ